LGWRWQSPVRLLVGLLLGVLSSVLMFGADHVHL
jgi:hypothetical protein